MKSGFGDLMEYDTAQYLGPATEEQLDASQAAAFRDGGAGVILVDDAGRVLRADDPDASGTRRCYVQD